MRAIHASGNKFPLLYLEWGTSILLLLLWLGAVVGGRSVGGWIHFALLGSLLSLTPALLPPRRAL